MAIDPSTITWDKAPQPSAGVSAPASKIDPSGITWDEPKKTGDYGSLIDAASSTYGVPADLIKAVVQQESGGNPTARSGKGAKGLMQLMPSTAADLGVSDVNDPAQSIDGGTRYLAQMLKKYDGDQTKALAAYNWGPGNVDKFGTKLLPKETQDYIAKINDATNYQDKPPAVFDLQHTDLPVPESDTGKTIARTALGLKRGLLNDIDNAGTQVMSMLIPDKFQRILDYEGKTGAEHVADQEAYYQKQRENLGGQGMDLGRLIGDIASPPSLALGASGGATAATAGRLLPEAFAKLSPKAQAILAPMLRGAGAAAEQPVDGSSDLATEKAKQLGVGAALGPIAEGAGKILGSTAGRIWGALKGEIQPKAAAAQDLGNQFGVQLTAGDLAPQSKALTGIEGALENQRLPFASMAPTRAAQQSQAKAAAQSLLDDQAKALTNMSYLGPDRLKAVADGGGVRSAEAKKVMQMIADAGPDERAIMQASGNNMWLTKKISADKLFGEVSNLAGDASVPPTQTLKAIDDALKSAGKVVDLDPASMAQLRKWKSQLEQPTEASLDDPIESAVNHMEGAPAGGNPIPNTYQRMRQFRSDLGTRINQATTNQTTDASKLFLKNISAGVENDLDNFAQNTPGLADANARAQTFYRDKVVPYQKQKLASALTADDPDQIYGAFIRSQAEGRGDYAAKRLFTALDNKGQQAVRYGIVKQAMGNATDGGEFSPSTFRDSLRNTEYSTYFKGPDLARVDKIIELFGHLRHADPEHLKKYSPMLGGQMGLGGTGLAGAVGGIAAGNPLGAAATAAGVIGGAKILRFLMTSDSGKRLLFSQNVFNKGGSQEGAGRLMDELMRRYSGAAGTAGGAETGEPGRVLP